MGVAVAHWIVEKFTEVYQAEAGSQETIHWYAKEIQQKATSSEYWRISWEAAHRDVTKIGYGWAPLGLSHPAEICRR